MKLRFAFSVVLLSVCINVFGQQQKSAPTQKQLIEYLTTTVSNQQETLSQLQTENKELLKQLDKMEQEIAIYREDVRSKISELDAQQDRWTAWIIAIVSLLAGGLGIVLPMIINNKNDQKLQKQIDTATEKAKQAEEAATKTETDVTKITEQMDTVTKQVEDATKQANEAKQAVTDIQELKQQVEKIQKKVNKDTEAAEKAANKAKSSQLFNEAFNEKDKLTAIDLYDQAIKIRPDFLQAYNNRGLLKYHLGDNKGALADYNKAIEIKTDYPSAYYNRGLLKQRQDDITEALKDYNKAIELNPNNDLYYKTRAKCLRKLADSENDEKKKEDYISKAENDEKKVESLKKEQQ